MCKERLVIPVNRVVYKNSISIINEEARGAADPHPHPQKEPPLCDINF
jgi:hypothetical protein